MANYFRITDRIEISPGTKFIKKNQLQLIEQGDGILNEARDKAQSLVSQAQENYEKEVNRGYQDGLERSNQEKAEVVQRAKVEIAEYTKKLEDDFVSIIESILLKVLGDFDKRDLVLKMVQNSLKDYTKAHKLRLLVKPEHVAYLEEHIKTIVDRHPVIEFIEVVADYSVEEGGCVIDTQSQMIFISLEDQINTILNAVKISQN